MLLLFVSLVSSQAQSDKQIINIGGQVLAKGKITDESTSMPIGTNLEFKSESGKRIKTLSNSITGNWELLLPEGKYEVVLFSWNIARKIDYIEIIAGTKFKEIERNFTVKRMLPNDIMFKMKAFADNSTVPNKTILKELDELKETMKFNRGVEFIVYVNAMEMFPPTQDYARPQEEVKPNAKTKGKAKKKPQAIVESKPIETKDYSELIKSRVAEINAYFDDWGTFRKRIRVLADLSNTKTKFPNNLSVIVEKNEDVFNK